MARTTTIPRICDLVISGLIGLRPRADDIIEVNPLVPEGAWDYFCLDQVRYHGRNLTILYDKTGERYGRGKGLQVLANGQRIAGSESLQRVTAQLPKDLGSAPKAADHSPWIFACQPDNDLYRVVAAGLGRSPPRFDAPSAAVAQAPPGAASAAVGRRLSPTHHRHRTGRLRRRRRQEPPAVCGVSGVRA